MLPLHAQIPRDSFGQATTAHSGLLFDKFPDSWEKENYYKLADNAKKQFFLDVINKYQTTTPLLEANLIGALARQHALLNHFKVKGQSLTVTTDWRFVSGLGSAHPYETGFIWHRTLSVPYLPGSSVKGMMRTWATHWGGLIEQQEITRLFGAKDGEENCGALIVFDALPSKPPKLEIDILNPHYSEYYQNPVNPPADYLSPIPVFFLTVAPEQDFEFFLAPRPGASEQPQQDLETGLQLMLEALEILGAGGKTAVGYGVFKESKAAEQKREAEQAKKIMQQEDEQRNIELNNHVRQKAYTGLAEQIYRQAQLENWETSDNATQFYQAMPDYLQKIDAESDLEIKQTAIGIISEILDKKFPGIMQEPKKKGGKNKDKFIYKDKPKDIANQLLTLMESANK